MRGIHRWPVNSPHKGPVTRKKAISWRHHELADSGEFFSTGCGVCRREVNLVHLQTISLQWRHNERDGFSNHQPHDCLLNRLFRRRSKKASNRRVTGLCEGNSPVTGEFPAQRVINAENASNWWRHHVTLLSDLVAGLQRQRRALIQFLYDNQMIVNLLKPRFLYDYQIIVNLLRPRFRHSRNVP